MLGILSLTTVNNMTNDNIKALGNKLFSKSEVQNRIAKNALKVILGDMTTLYNEFRTASGLGALFFNTMSPLNSLYMTTKEIYNDIILAEELMDTDTKEFLQKTLNVIEKNSDNTTPVVVMVDSDGMSIHLLDLDEISQRIDQQAEEAAQGL
jgi:hypothetical protein